MIGRAGLGPAIVAVALLASCRSEEHVVGRGEESSSAGAVDSCPQFDPGTNMLEDTWSTHEESADDAARFAQRVGDADVTSGLAITDLHAACRDLAASLPGDASELGSPSVPPTEDDAREACDVALAAIEALRSITAATPTITAVAEACDVQGAYEACLPTCADVASCQDFCTTARTWLADCPPAEVTIDFDQEVGAEVQAYWDEVEGATARVIAVRSRVALVEGALLGIATAARSNFYLKADCVEPLFGSATATTKRGEVAADLVDSFVDALEVGEEG